MLHRSGSTERTWKSQLAIDAVARCVCSSCNSGWMGVIEQAAQPVITQMILGQRVTLDVIAQDAVSAWLALKAVLARYFRSPPDRLNEEWLAYFFRHHRPPDTWYIWLAGFHAVAGSPVFYYDGHDITLSFPDDPTSPAVTPHGELATFVIGYFAAKVFGIRGGTPSYTGPDWFLRIAPPENPSVVWPPPHAIDDASLIAFCNMYLDGTPPKEKAR